MLSKIKQVKDAVQEIVDKGATSVEEIHKSIARIPFKHIEETAGDQVKSYVEPVENFQTKTISAVYDLIRKVNREVGGLADAVLGKLGEPGTKTEATPEATPSA